MEVPQWGNGGFGAAELQVVRLNPYSNGSTTMGDIYLLRRPRYSCLNPYSNGSTTMGRIKNVNFTEKDVLILILMEVPQWAKLGFMKLLAVRFVLILILMEVPQWEHSCVFKW